MKPIFYILIIIISYGSYEGYSQELDTVKIIQDIQEKFALIHGKKIKGIKECSYIPNDEIEEELDEIPTGGAHEVTFYFADNNIYLVREYIMSDEGGPLTYSASISETYLFNNEPFFYYQKDFSGDSYDDDTGQLFYGLQETRKYIYNGKIIRELSKYTKKEGIWLFDKYLFLNVRTDSVPNTKQEIEKYRDDFYWDSDIIKNFLDIIEKEYDDI